jgi:hypothetical protein
MPIIHIYPALKLIFLSSVFYVLGCVALIVSELPWYIKLSLLLLLLTNYRSYFRRNLNLSNDIAVVAFWKSNKEWWSLKLSNGRSINGHLRKTSIITRFLMVLYFECESSLRQTIILIPESIGHQAYRRLLVYIYHFEPR